MLLFKKSFPSDCRGIHTALGENLEGKKSEMPRYWEHPLPRIAEKRAVTSVESSHRHHEVKDPPTWRTRNHQHGDEDLERLPLGDVWDLLCSNGDST